VWFSHISLFWFPVFVRCILLSRIRTVYFIFFRLCAVFNCFRLKDYLWSVQIQSMSTLVSSTLHIRRHGYSGHFNIVIFVGLCNFPFYAINTDTASLFADLSLLFLTIMNLYCIDVLQQYEWISFVLSKKKILLCRTNFIFVVWFLLVYWLEL
jgi:hypothetical protein